MRLLSQAITVRHKVKAKKTILGNSDIVITEFLLKIRIGKKE